ncbi:MAG: cohesin domain-containing protein [Anaerolineaceae bacterium]|nr:cohesin domain-containing protein [Anaerolineaceae bacterium]
MIDWISFVRYELGLLLAATLLFMLASIGQADAPTDPDPVFNMATQNVAVGQSFDVPVYLGTTSAARSAQFDISFNPAVVRVNSVQEGTFFKTFAQQHGGGTSFNPGTIDNTTGKVSNVSISLTRLAGLGPSGSDTIVVINFTGLSNGKSTTNMTNATVSDLSGNPLLPIVVIGGTITVGPLPKLAVSALNIQPTGTGANFGYQFKIQFSVTNTGGINSDPTNATIAADGVNPGYQQVSISALAPNASQSFVLANYQLQAESTTITVTIPGYGSQSINYGFAPVTANGQTPVFASISPLLKISLPGQVIFPNLKIGPNVVNATVNIQCNTNYEVDVADDGMTNWHMTEWDGSNFKSSRLGDPFQVMNLAQGTSVTSATSPRLINGGLAGQSGDAGQNFNLAFSQELHYSDPLLSTDENYRLILTFNSYVTL